MVFKCANDSSASAGQTNERMVHEKNNRSKARMSSVTHPFSTFFSNGYV